MHKLIVVCICVLGILSCRDLQNSVSVSTHPAGWTDENSSNFHGAMVLQSVFNYENCKSCHGPDLAGGSSGVSCGQADCHQVYPHKNGWTDSLSTAFHGSYIADTLGWNLELCTACHGTDYKGAGVDEKDCTICHTQPGGPEACSTCHGSGINFAPPRDLAGHTETSFTGVGAHQVHLNDTTYTTSFDRDCDLCHIKPTEFDDPTHIDGNLPAEVHFGLFATDSSALNSSWDHTTATCNNVYCHGAFKFRKEDAGVNSWIFSDSVITGNNPAMIWNQVDGSQDACGTCHGLPPTGHLAQTTCNGCHPRVVNDKFEIIDKSLHINGRADVF